MSNNSRERSPLLLKQQSSIIRDYYHHHRGHASVTQTVINLAKTCMGTGCLALPFAAQQSGILLFVLGTFAISLWNVYAVQRLCHSWELVQRHYSMMEEVDHRHHRVNGNGPEEEEMVSGGKYQSNALPLPFHEEEAKEDEEEEEQAVLMLPPEGASTLGIVTWYAFGYQGLRIMDLLMIILLFGIIVAYQDAILSFLNDTVVAPFFLWNAFGSASLMATLSVVHDVGALTKGSAFGLLVLFASMSILTVYGIVSDYSTTNKNMISSLSSSSSSSWLLPPNGLTGISQWFGCVVFGFGTVPLTYNFQASMAQPNKMVSATMYALVGFVATCYIILGIGLLYLYPNLEGDVLHVLPTDFWLAQVTRWAMVVVILVTAPLLVVPCGQLIEGKLHPNSTASSTNGTASPSTTSTTTSVWTTRYLVRFSVCYTCAVISTLVPGFVNVLSLVGCTSVALVSFCVPPLLHLAVVQKSEGNDSNNDDDGDELSTRRRRKQQQQQRYLDLVMLLGGILATSISTVYTLCKMTSFCYRHHQG